jgi:hypothetical protein
MRQNYQMYSKIWLHSFKLHLADHVSHPINQVLSQGCVGHLLLGLRLQEVIVGLDNGPTDSASHTLIPVVVGEAFLQGFSPQLVIGSVSSVQAGLDSTLLGPVNAPRGHIESIHSINHLQNNVVSLCYEQEGGRSIAINADTSNK